MGDVLLEQTTEVSQLPLVDYITHLKGLKAPQAIAPELDAIADRLKSEMSIPREGNDSKKATVHELGFAVLGLFVNVSRDQDIQIPRSTLEKYYNGITSRNPDERFHARQYIQSILDLEERVEVPEGEERFAERLPREFASTLLSTTDQIDVDTSGLFMIRFVRERQDLGEEILITCVQQAQTEKDFQRMRGVVDFFNLTTAKQILRDYAREHPEFTPHWQRFNSFFMTGAGEEVLTTEQLYTQADVHMDAETYAPYAQIDAFEAALIHEEFRGEGEVIDVGSGPGRNIDQLIAAGKKAVAIDLVPSHIEELVRRHPGIEAYVASWLSIPVTDKRFKYALAGFGRGSLHNTPSEMIEFFAELARVTTDDGVALIDIPDQNVGHYAKARERFEQAASEKGVAFNPGSVTDSPDEVLFNDRFALSEEQLIAAARLAGFRTEFITEHPYDDDKGNTNMNLYFRLVKDGMRLDEDERYDLRHIVTQAYFR